MLTIGAIIALIAASTVLGGAINYGAQKDAQAFNAEEAEKQREFSSTEAQASRDFTADQNAITRIFNSEEAEKARQFQLQMDSTKYQRQVEDMKAAGLNLGAIGASPGGAPGVSTASAGAAGAAGSAGGYAAQSGIGNIINISALASAANSVLGENHRAFIREYMSNSVSDAKKVSDVISKVYRSKYSDDVIMNTHHQLAAEYGISIDELLNG